MGRIIGKSGATINNIREVSGARVDAEDKDDEMCEFKIQGKPQAVSRAKAMILEVAKKQPADHAKEKSGAGDRGGETDKDGDGISETIDFPASIMGSIIGARGCKIQEARNASGAKITVEKADGKCQVQISGTADQVDKAKHLVRNLAEEDLAGEGGSGSRGGAAGDRGDDRDGGAERGGNQVSNVLEFPVGVTGRIIGSGGSQIKELRHESGARVSVEKCDTSCKVHISGTPEEVDKARTLVNALADEGQSGSGPRRDARATDQMEVPLSMVGRVIGKGGEMIQRLQRESGARLDVNTGDGDPCIVRISGSRDSCSRARFMIAEVLDRGSHLADGRGGDRRDRDFDSGYWGPGSDSGQYGGFGGSQPPGFAGGLPPAGDGSMPWQGYMGAMPGAGMWGGSMPGYPSGYPLPGKGSWGDYGADRDRDRNRGRDRREQRGQKPREQPREKQEGGAAEERPSVREIDPDEL